MIKKIDKAQSAFDLIDCIDSIHIISCSSCNRKESISCPNDYPAAQRFYEQGWRIVKERPKCSFCSGVIKVIDTTIIAIPKKKKSLPSSTN